MQVAESHSQSAWNCAERPQQIADKVGALRLLGVKLQLLGAGLTDREAEVIQELSEPYPRSLRFERASAQEEWECWLFDDPSWQHKALAGACAQFSLSGFIL